MKDFLFLSQKIKKYKEIVFDYLKVYLNKNFYFILILFFILFIFLTLLNLFLKREIVLNATFRNPFKEFKQSYYPKLNINSSLVLHKNLYPSISAKSFLVLDNDSQVVLFSENSNLRFSLASTTKIMTALVALDYFKMDDVLTVKEDSIEGAKVGFLLGEKMNFENILYGMLLPSGNDAALTIAQNFKGGEVEFVKKMNEKAIKLNLYNTNFVEPTGLDDIGNYTTPLDLARLSSIAINNKTFAKFVSTPYKEISNIDGTRKYFVKNLNKLLGKYSVNGIKTGFTEEAGQVLVTSKLENGHTLIIVVMKSKDRFLDTEQILSFLSKKIEYLNLKDFSY